MHASEPVIDYSKVRSSTMSQTTFNGALDFKNNNFYMGIYTTLKHWVMNIAVPTLQELNDSGSAPSSSSTTRFAFMPKITGGTNIIQDRLYCTGSNINSWMSTNTGAWTGGTTQVITGGTADLVIPNKYQLPTYPNAEGVMFSFSSTNSAHWKKDEETPGAWTALANSASGAYTQNAFAHLWTYNTDGGDCIYRVNSYGTYKISIEKYTISTNTWSWVANEITSPTKDFLGQTNSHYATDGTYIYITQSYPWLSGAETLDPFRYVYRIDPTTIANGDSVTPYTKIMVSDIYTADMWASHVYKTQFIATFDGIKYLYETTHNGSRSVTWRTPLVIAS